MMTRNDQVIRTGADLIEAIGRADLSPTRRRDMVSAVNRVASMTSASPVHMKLDVPGLRERLAGIKPAAHGITPQTYAKIRSNFSAALEWAGVVEPTGRGAAKRDPAWGPLSEAVAGDKRISSGLSSFMNWCVLKGIGPGEVRDSSVREFLAWLETRTLHPRPRAVVWSLPVIWNDARAAVPGWPGTELTRISFRAPSPNLRWDDLPVSFRSEAEDYLTLRREPDVFSTDADHPRRPLAASTLDRQREHIRLAASILVRKGGANCAPGSLADLVRPEAFKTVLRHYLGPDGRKPNAFATTLARTLLDVARYQVKLPPPAMQELKAIAAKLPAMPFELTAKNKALLSGLESDRVKARLLFMPQTLIQGAQAKLKAGRSGLVEAQVAIAVDILLVAPLRPQNLIALNWSKHIREPNGSKGALSLFIPKQETKSGKRDLTFEIPAETAQRIRWYRREILGGLGADIQGPLFVNKHGLAKSQETLSEQITDAVARHVGIHMTPHQFRHFAAALYLEEHPEGFQSVSDLLGHAWAKTTLVYAGSSSRRASRAYGAHVTQQREH
jgi:integrase